MMQMQLLIVLISLSAALFRISISSTDTISPGQPLHDGQTLVSAVGAFALGFFIPAGSKNKYVGIWYNRLPVRTAVWVANRHSPIADSNATMELNSKGTLTINSMIFLPMPSVVLTNPVAQLLDNGNLVIRETNSSEFAWQSFDYPTDTLLAGMKLGWDLRTGLNRNLTAWRSNDDPSSGRYTFSVDINGSPQLTLLVDSAKIWRSGPWNGAQFSNTPTLTGLGLIKFANTEDEVYFIYDTIGTDMVARLTVNHAGMLQWLLWMKNASEWVVFWSVPQTQCDRSSLCGPNAICDVNNSPMCSCLQGFFPKSAVSWAAGNTTSGCVRRLELDCKNKTDGFMTITPAILPDTATAIVNTSTISITGCREKCLANCSCTGYTSADIRGTGCIIWMKDLVGLGTASYEGQDFYVRLAAAELAISTSAKSRAKAKVAIITVLSGVTLVIFFVSFFVWRKKKMKRRALVAYEKTLQDNDEIELPQLEWTILMEATDNFIETNILGKGGFGSVYKGKLAEGCEIAVKRLSKNSAQGIDEFKNEVILIAKLQHRNLVRLLGYCIQGDERILVYEHMSNGSLDAFLFDIVPNGVKLHLDWQTRFHIIVGIARGLLYLHQDSRLRIIHRDLKASNILLDREMNPKISDFGLARIFGENETITKTRKVVGTYGYMAPEYALDGIFSVKSDVFSFGVLILEIISGQRNRVFISTPHLYLLGNAWSLWNEGNALDLLDPLIGNSFSITQVMKCINIGLLCVQGKPEDRPIMSSVVSMLSNDDGSLAEPKAPGFKAILSSEVESTSNHVELLSCNNVTLTEQTGR